MSEIQNSTSFEAQLDDLKVITITDGEVWSARDLMPYAGYERWENWFKAIQRAASSINASGILASDHFRDSTKMIETGKGARREVADVELTRHACYILFQNADGSKPEVAAAQLYFAIQTRKSEIAAQSFDPTTVEGAVAVIQAAQTALAALAVAQPKADAWDELASADGDYEVADAAKMLARTGIATGQRRLFASLARLGWIFRGSQGAWRAYQDVVDTGYLAELPQSHYHPRTGEVVIDPPQVRVTVRGLDRLRILLRTSTELEAAA